MAQVAIPVVDMKGRAKHKLEGSGRCVSQYLSLSFFLLFLFFRFHSLSPFSFRDPFKNEHDADDIFDGI